VHNVSILLTRARDGAHRGRTHLGPHVAFASSKKTLAASSSEPGGSYSILLSRDKLNSLSVSDHDWTSCDGRAQFSKFELNLSSYMPRASEGANPRGTRCGGYARGAHTHHAQSDPTDCKVQAQDIH
jgi:hypothetical protein